jgi:hypothetical protein
MTAVSWTCWPGRNAENQDDGAGDTQADQPAQDKDGAVDLALRLVSMSTTAVIAIGLSAIPIAIGSDPPMALPIISPAGCAPLAGASVGAGCVARTALVPMDGGRPGRACRHRAPSPLKKLTTSVMQRGSWAMNRWPPS